MAMNLAQKIISEHLVSGTPETGKAIAIRIDQTLTQDATGTMAYLQFEAIGVDRIAVPLAVSYVDHNMLQSDFRNADDHKYLRTAAARYGAYFSAPGNGICHQVHLERFAAPGATLIGSDSHTPTAGGMGSIAIGVGGLDIATTMAGSPLEITMPKVVGVHLTGELTRPWVTAMDVILELLRRLTVKGGVGRIMEYYGDGVATLTLTQRATITNMGAELGATTSVFPSDEQTRTYLKAQDRESAWRPMAADNGATYDESVEINLSALPPMIAKPHGPDNVVQIKQVEGAKVDQVCVGSCTNSSYPVMKGVAKILQGRNVAPTVSMTVTPGSKQVFQMIAKEGDMATMIGAGARILESACGPCIGMGQAPPSGGVSIRSFNRNFKGRSGTADANVYLCNPFAATAMAIAGEIKDPRELGIEVEATEQPEAYAINDAGIIPPPADYQNVEVIKGPNIQPVPSHGELPDRIEGQVLLKVEDNITTDHIMPAGAQVLPLRSNIPAISEFVFRNVDPSFAERAKKMGGGIIIGGENYGQGSSREHAALAPMYLGVTAVIAKSFARIHHTNLVNFGILPLVFASGEAYDEVDPANKLELDGLRHRVEAAQDIEITNVTKGCRFRTQLCVTDRQRDILLAGGLLPFTKGQVTS